MDSSSSHFITLPPSHEYRIELDPPDSLAVRTHPSSPPTYINNQELPPNTWYPLYPDSRLSIWNPSTTEEVRLEMTSEPTGAYESGMSTWGFVRNLHLGLEGRRIMAKRAIKARHLAGGGGMMDETKAELRKEEMGPRVMVLGGASAGKSTLVKGLVNLALSSGMGWGVGVVGLDPSNSPHLIPGSLSLSTLSHPVPTHHPAHPLGSPPTTSTSTTISSDVPTLSWFLGMSELSNSGGGTGKVCWEVWRRIVAEMGSSWRKRCVEDEVYRSSGLFIDTHSNSILPNLGVGKNDKVRYGLVREAVEAFDVNVLLVIGNEKLTVEMEKIFSPLGITILRVPKSSGTVDLDEAYRFRVKSQQVKTYFYGEPSVPAEMKEGMDKGGGKVVGMESGLHPYSFTIGWDDLEIYRVGQDSAAPSSAMPIGQKVTISPTRLTRVDPSAPATVHRLQNAILGLVVVSDADIIPGMEEKRQSRKGKEKEEEVKEEQGTGAAEKVDVGTGEEVKQEEGDVKEEGKEENDEEEEEEEEEEEPIWQEWVAWRECTGFLAITRVDTVKRKYEILTPSPGKLPSRVAIVGNVEWAEEDN